MDKIKITINGKPSEIARGKTVAEVLTDLNIQPELVACEHNLKILRRATFAQTALQDGDNLEILRMIGGG